MEKSELRSSLTAVLEFCKVGFANNEIRGKILDEMDLADWAFEKDMAKIQKHIDELKD